MQLNKDKILLMVATQGRTVPEVAKSYGVTKTRLYAMLNSRNVMPATAIKLAQTLGVDVTEILE